MRNATCFEKEKKKKEEKPLVWGYETQAPRDSATGHIQYHADTCSSASLDSLQNTMN